MILTFFVIVCAGWGVLLGSTLVAVMAALKRLVELTGQPGTGVVTSFGYWVLAAGMFVTLHLNYVDGDDIGRHTLATLGFYIGAAIPFVLGPVRRRAILRAIR